MKLYTYGMNHLVRITGILDDLEIPFHVLDNVIFLDRDLNWEEKEELFYASEADIYPGL